MSCLFTPSGAVKDIGGMLMMQHDSRAHLWYVHTEKFSLSSEAGHGTTRIEKEHSKDEGEVKTASDQGN